MEKKKTHIAIKIIAIILGIIVFLVAALYGIWWYVTKDFVGEVYKPGDSVSVDSGVITEVEVTPLPTEEPTPTPEITASPEPTEIPLENDDKAADEIVEVSALQTLKSKILAWRENGSPASADGVTNILLIGMDNASSNVNINSRADAMMLLSLNHNTKKITLVSLLRDQYCCIVNGSKKSFEKLHHANAYGGPTLQIKTVEAYYKISIDNYAIVNFYTVPKIIDKLGGITVNLTANEANYMNKTYKLKLSEGTNTLNGATALKYMRIRYETGGDTARVNRQQLVLKQIIATLKSKSLAEVVSIVTELDDFIRTGYTSSQLLGLASDAVMNGWFSYSIHQLILPDGQCAEGFWVGKGWYWKTDFPVAAQKLQLALYCKTNIQLEDDRKSWLY